MAHEIGHNMGMSHDFASKHKGRGCNGIMAYGKSKDEWSQCSIGKTVEVEALSKLVKCFLLILDDFTATYELEIVKKGRHCMQGKVHN